ncbi:hypothetical protein [Kerstersia similis]|uniref:hypothetical protein n=1 Tax=Kerstersia similis TaxID=206505 RepID=UPI0039F01BAA
MQQPPIAYKRNLGGCVVSGCVVFAPGFHLFLLLRPVPVSALAVRRSTISLKHRYAGRGRFTPGVVAQTRWWPLDPQELAFRSLFARAKPG